jgi:hypothetical protein
VAPTNAPELAKRNSTCLCTNGAESGADSKTIKNIQYDQLLGRIIGGEGGIRTHGALARTAVFKTAALNRSATSPKPLA